MKELKLTDRILLVGLDSEEEMMAWIQKFNSMDGEDAPPFFEACCEYKGLVNDCKPKEKWVQKDGEMDSGGFWYKSYKTGDKYCKNHYRWSFESALEEIGNQKYIVVVDLDPPIVEHDGMEYNPERAEQSVRIKKQK